MSLFSLIQPALDALGICPQTIQISHIDSLIGHYYPNLSVDRPALIGPLNDESQCERLCDLIRLAYPADHAVKIVNCAPSAVPSLVRVLLLKELATVSLDQGPSLLYLPQLSYTGAVETFQDTVAHLRAPDGCPWDRKQTHRSLRQAFQEEVYEVLDTLDRDDLEGLQEELGDVLLQVLMHAQIASEAGEFQMSDVVHHIQTKIVRRHPHVFAGFVINGVDDVLVNWEEIKQREKDQDVKRSVLDSVSRAMPSLARTQSIQRHVDWMDGINIETDVLVARITAGVAALTHQAGPKERQTLLGDLLFDLGNLARQWRIDAESVLREANNRFEQHFRRWESERNGAQLGLHSGLQGGLQTEEN